ncbi:MAG: hypothetical protein M3Z28_04350 [Candidatus Dormibacteraeota bacterium]|nr:hypothetical protein [Candidatus Dormibacteraeota bacterium]
MTEPIPPGICHLCSGSLIAGTVALPVVGQAKFAYRLPGIPAIETEIDGTMCTACGAIAFTARDPKRIKAAHAAGVRARRAKT